MDKDSGAIYVDRFLHTSMQYPLNYGFIPHTLSNDGDPVDVLIANNIPIIPGAVVRVRPIGMLVMEDEAGEDEKVLTVPVDALHPYYSNVSSYRGLPQILLDQIAHFFAHYKDLERNKWVEIKRWAEADEACRMIEAAIRAAAAAKA
jgi:inorganic pyrophosphatase